MRIYELKPTSEALDDWEANEYKGTVIVRAQDEKSARDKVAVSEFGYFETIEEFGSEPKSPWQDDGIVTCKQLDNSEYEEEGPEEILSPKSEQL